MKAILYAAGRALRLGPAYAHTHKVLLPFGGRSLLERHVEHLRAVGATELVVVSGHHADLVEVELERSGRLHGLPVRSIRNERYEEGSVLSMEASLPEIEEADGPLLLMDGDVLYPRALLERLVASHHSTVMLVDRDYATVDDDPVLVPIRSGRPFDFVKRWAGAADAIGESIGFFKVAPAERDLLVAGTRARVAAGRFSDSLDDVLRDVALAGRFDVEDVTGLPWTEVDFPWDVERAASEILPAIERLEGTPSGAPERVTPAAPAPPRRAS